MFLFSSIHFQCFYRPDTQSINLSTEQTLNLPTEVSIYLLVSIYRVCVCGGFRTTPSFCAHMGQQISVHSNHMLCYSCYHLEDSDILRKWLRSRLAALRYHQFSNVDTVFTQSLSPHHHYHRERVLHRWSMQVWVMIREVEEDGYFMICYDILSI